MRRIRLLGPGESQLIARGAKCLYCRAAAEYEMAYGEHRVCVCPSVDCLTRGKAHLQAGLHAGRVEQK